jgi:uncharacterized membrane protein YkvA (DUF1232 family)
MNVIVGILLLFLVLSPIDLLPDVIPVIGWLDDAGYIVGALAAFAEAARVSSEMKTIEHSDESKV